MAQNPVDLVEERFQQCRQLRRPHEITWLQNSAYKRGLQNIEWDAVKQRLLSTDSVIPGKQKVSINRILPKLTARHAKLTKNPPRAEVIPATQEIEDKRNARLSQKFLNYAWRAFQIEEAYSDAILFAQEQGRGFLWVYWDPSKLATTATTDPQTGQSTVEQAPLGDIVVEADGAWSVFVPDASKPKLSQQPYIIRAKIRTVEWVQQRFGIAVPPDTSYEEAFSYERQIAGMNARVVPGMSSTGVLPDSKAVKDSTVVKEMFEAPTATYPKGRYVVIASQRTLKDQPELPYGFSDLANPYPCESLVDVLTPGQWWGTTYCEQLIGVQKEYNALRTIIRQHLKMLGKGKLMIPSQANIPENAWSSEPEKITYDYIPGMPQPFVWTPANIASDAWRLVDLLRDEIDVVSQIHANAEGMAASTNSGFQVNLLQEASDSAHAPVIRQHENAIASLYKKIRRLVKQGYVVPRMISVLGKNYAVEVQEFSATNVNETADIIIRAGSAMPDYKAARVQSVRELYTSGMFGDPADPNTRRKALSLLEMGEVEEAQEEASRDTEAAKQENTLFQQTGQIGPPQYYENHLDHHVAHTDFLKSDEGKALPPQVRQALIWHDILTLRYMDYNMALTVAAEFGLAQMVPPPPGPPPPPPQPAGAPPQAGSPAPAGQGPPGPPPQQGRQ